MLTITEQERAAYMAGNVLTAQMLAQIDDLKRELEKALARIDNLETDLYAARHERAYWGDDK